MGKWIRVYETFHTYTGIKVSCTLLCDTNHVLQSDYSNVIGAGADAVDCSRRYKFQLTVKFIEKKILYKGKDMKGMKITQYQFDKISKQMENEFGKMRKGEEQHYEMMLFPMESNLLKIHRANPNANSRRLAEAISIVLYQIKGYLGGETYDVESFKNQENSMLAHALLMAFDPFTNSEIREVIEGEQRVDLSKMEDLKKLYKEPVMCINRIKDSVEVWGKRGGANGYFDFISSAIGKVVKQDEELNYSITI